MERTTEHGPFTVVTSPTVRPEGRNWGRRHWRFTITAGESRETYSGVYSAGSSMDPATLHEGVLYAVATDSPHALAGGGDLRTTIEELQNEGLGYDPLAAYDVAVSLVELHGFIAALDDGEREVLESFGVED